MIVYTLLATQVFAAPLAPPVPPTPPAPLTAPAAPRLDFDEQVHITGETNDVFSAGKTLHVDDPVSDNAFLAAEDVHINAAIHGDLFSMSETLHIDAPVHGDVYALAGSVEVGPEGRVYGHILAGGSVLDIQGPVGGSVTAGAGQVTIAAPVGGDVSLEAGELVMRDDGHIGGDLVYTTPTAADSVDSRVDGSVSWTEGEHAGDEDAEDEVEEDDEPGFFSSLRGQVLWAGWGFLAKLLVGGAMLLLGGQAAGRAGRLLVEQPSQSLGTGLAGFVLLPIVSMIACVLIIPLPLGVLGLMAFSALLYIGQIVAAQGLGDVILRQLRPGAWGSPVVSMAVGLAALVLLSSLPWVGGLVWFSATVLGGGALWLRTRELARG